MSDYMHPASLSVCFVATAPPENLINALELARMDLDRAIGSPPTISDK
jgi:hypothetical protein